MRNHPYPGKQQKKPEKNYYPVKPVDQGDAGEDEYRPHNDSSQNSPEKYPVCFPVKDKQVECKNFILQFSLAGKTV